MGELTAIKNGIFWALCFGFMFGVSDRILATATHPTADQIGLLTISSLCFALFLFLKPVGGDRND